MDNNRKIGDAGEIIAIKYLHLMIMKLSIQTTPYKAVR
jgi:hypothetical protein